MNFIQIVISSLVSSGILLTIFYFLFNRLINYQFEKQIEKFKTKLAIEQKLLAESSMHALKYEIRYLRLVWRLSYSVLEKCKNYNEENNKLKLPHAINKLERFLEYKKPYINSKTYQLAKNLADIADPEHFTPNEINSLINAENNLISSIRSSLLISND